jgi:serine kinase of HPr protein (carbohydrate metabolism regulator)
MGMRLITGPANSGKAEFALDAVREHLKRRRDPLLIVPRAADRAVYVRELAGSGATLGLRVERFTGLFRLVAARAGIT